MQEQLIDVEQGGSEFVETFLKYRNTIAIVVVSVSLVLALTLRFILGGSKAEGEFFQAEEQFAKWESISNVDDAILEQLQQSMRAHPELAEKFGSAIAQRYLALELSDQAGEFRKYIEDKRLPIRSPYSEYAKGTYLIAAGKYEQALASTLNLIEQLREVTGLDETKVYGKDLYAFTLLRLAGLHQELKNGEEELAAWSELKQFLDANTIRGQAIIDHLTDQKVSLYDFIASREALLGA